MEIVRSSPPAQRTAVRLRPHHETTTSTAAMTEPVVHHHGREKGATGREGARPPASTACLAAALRGSHQRSFAQLCGRTGSNHSKLRPVENNGAERTHSETSSPQVVGDSHWGPGMIEVDQHESSTDEAVQRRDELRIIRGWGKPTSGIGDVRCCWAGTRRSLQPCAANRDLFARDSTDISRDCVA